MAETVEFTINVDDSQFKAFMGRFDELTKLITNLTDSLKQSAETIEKTSKKTDALANSMKSLLDVSKSIHGTMSKITTHIGKWATLISGTVMLIATGRGLLGLDKLTERGVELRRQTLGISTTPGGYQQAQIAGLGFTGKEGMAGIIERVEAGRRGDPELQQDLITALGGMPDKGEDTKSVVRRLLQQLGQSPAAGGDLRYGKGLGYMGLLGQTEFMRLTGGEKQRTAREETISDLGRKDLDMDPAVLANQQKFGKAGAELITAFQNMLSKLVDPLVVKLTEFAKKLTEVLESIKSWSDVVRKIQEFAKWLAGEDVSTAWNNFVNKLKEWAADPKWETFKGLLGQLINLLAEIIPGWSRLKDLADKPTPQGALDYVGGVAKDTFNKGNWPIKLLTGQEPTELLSKGYEAGKSILFGTGGGSAPKSGGTGAPDITNQLQQYNQSNPLPKGMSGQRHSSLLFGGGGGGTTFTMATPVNRGGANMSFAANNARAGFGGSIGFGGSSLFSSNAFNAGNANLALGDRGAVRMAMLNATGGDTRTTNAVANAGSANMRLGGPQIGMWSQAAKAAQPPPPVRNYVATVLAQSGDRTPPRTGGASRGPLSPSNWEGSRVATLRIDNTPGANVTTSGVTMAG